MIVVIADDLTGAAELSGLALRFGLTSVITLQEVSPVDADVLVVSTDSRSLSTREAIRMNRFIIQQAQQLQPEFIYKKIDSVLRGHVLEELNVLLEETGLQKALVIPANPLLERRIVNGLYYVNDTLVNETSFANDPEFPITSADVVKMVIGENQRVQVLSVSDLLPEKGIVIGEIQSEHEMQLWASKADASVAKVGAGDFFMALLQQKYKQVQAEYTAVNNITDTHLFISGTTFQKSAAAIRSVQQQQPVVCYLPVEFITNGANGEVYKYFGEQVKKTIHQHKKAIIAFDGKRIEQLSVSAKALRDQMASVIRYVLSIVDIQEIFIEGGATAAAILNILDIRKLVPVNEITRGVVRMKAGGNKEFYITIKPGSYAWPPNIQRLYLNV